MGIQYRSPGKWQVFADDGTPGVGYKLYTYIPGTTTNKNTYLDDAGASAQTNPIIFDARGEAVIFWDGEYDLKLTTDADVQVWTLSNFGAGESYVNYGNYNLVTDGGFEDDSNGDGLPDNWTVTTYPNVSYGAGSAILDSSTQIEGLYALKFTSQGDGGGYAVSGLFNVREGGTVAAQWSMKSTVAGVRNVVELIWYNSAQVQISTSSLYDDSATNPTVWTQKNGSATAVTNARYAKLRVTGCHSSDVTSGSTWYDAIQVVSDMIAGDFSIINNLTVSGTFTSSGISDSATSNVINIDSSNNLSILSIATLTALKAMAVPASSGFEVSVRGRNSLLDGYEGIFIWNSSNLSTEVTSDTQNGIYVPPNSDTTGSSGAWVRRDWKNGYLNVLWFGLIGDNSTNNDTALSAVESFAPEYSTLFFPLRNGGTYVITAYSWSSKVLRWIGESVIDTSGNAVSSSTIKGSGSTVISLSNTSSRFSSIENMRILASAGNTAINISNLGTILKNVTADGGAYGIKTLDCVAVEWDNVTAYGTTCGWQIYPGTGQVVNLNTFINVSTASRNSTGTACQIAGTATGSVANNIFIGLDCEQSNTGLNITTSGALANTFINFWSEAFTGTSPVNINDVATSYSIFINPHNDSSGSINYGSYTVVHGSANIYSGYYTLKLNGGISGYELGSGGAVIQTTSKTTAVTLNTACGQITTDNSLLGAGATAVFNLNNSYITTNCILNLTLQSSGPTPGNYSVKVSDLSTGIAYIAIKNESSGDLSDAVLINYKISYIATS